MTLPRLMMLVGLNMIAKRVSENPRALYKSGIDNCIMHVEYALRVRGYEEVGECTGKGESVSIEVVRRLDRGSKVASIHCSKTECNGKKWQRGRREVFICDCGFSVPVVATNIPNAYQGDYDMYGRVYFDSDGFVCPKLGDIGHTPISPVEIIKMYRRGEL